MPYKILIAHQSGMVGKSTTVASLLYPRLPGSLKVFSVEDVNQDAARYGLTVHRYRAADFSALWHDINMETANVLVDVGASNYLQFMNEIMDLEDAINDFKAVIIPCTPDRRAQEETVTTIEDLSKAGLAPHKLRVIFNRSTSRRGTPPDHEYRVIVAYLKDHPEYSYYEDLVVPNKKVHTDLAAAGKSIADILSDATDHQAELEKAIKQNVGPKEQERLLRAATLQRAVRGAELDLQSAFRALRLPFESPTAEA
ncbi:hypothetical protein [Paraburkholderia sp. J8-2]|uniref:hypothetical protein n=1 Tax=Paraburkholderia sp. J8-2 TaxID=2805440 RepID=UPI002AB703B9|nr:hypothetical protein [Paraburkholderia sp. J8-2]